MEYIFNWTLQRYHGRTPSIPTTHNTY